MWSVLVPAEAGDAETLLEAGFMPIASLKHEPAALVVRYQSIAEPAASLAGLTLHILDVEEYLAGLARREAAEWAGENGSRMEESAASDELLLEIERIDLLIVQALEMVSVESLGSVQPGGERTVGEALVEDLDHSAMHYGHMQLTRHAWEAAHPDAAPTYAHWR